MWTGKKYESLKIPEITLTWYALSGEAKTSTKDTNVIGYTTLILDFCQKAGIKNLAFPFMVPDKNNRPWIINGGKGGLIPTNYQDQINYAVKWIQKNVLKFPFKN